MSKLKPWWKTLFSLYGIIICLVALTNLTFNLIVPIEWLILLAAFICLGLGI
jgi:hypothetical protein